MRRLLVLLPLLAGCVSGGYARSILYQPPGPTDRLRPGEANLTECLDALGAPLHVREHGDGAVLVWGWAREAGWGARVSVPVEGRSASFSYESRSEGMEGLALFFDADWTLTAIRTGRLADVLPPSQRRARVVEPRDGSAR